MKMMFFLAACAISMAVSAQDSTHKELLGKYKFPAGSVIEEVTVTWENGIINMNSSAGVSAIEKIAGDTFNIVTFNGIAVFKRDDAKKITAVHIDASGYVLDGVKEVVTIADYLDERAAATQVKIREQIQEYLQSGGRLRPVQAVCIYN